MWQNTSKSDGGSDEGIQLFITSNGELQMTRSDTFDFEIFGGVTSELQDFSSEVFKNGGHIDGS